jgi:uncharacterized protein (DUF983 family)
MTSTQPAVSPVLAGARGRCPRCGKGALFKGYITIAPACSVCGLSFAGHDAGDGPAFFIMLPLSIITALLALLFDNFVAPPMWVHMLLWPTFIALAVGFSLRPVKGIMVGLQYRYRNVESDNLPNQ